MIDIKRRHTNDILHTVNADNLNGADLSRANLSRADLGNANLIGADLSDANLSCANLYGANLYGANLYGANLYGADLSGANLNGANLNGADLSHANLYGADLSDANFRGANLSCANLYGADLSGANLNGANLNGANLNGADLSHANLNGAYLNDVEGMPQDPYDLVVILNDPMRAYPHNFSTPKKANALLMCLCQEAADEIERLKLNLRRRTMAKLLEHPAQEHSMIYEDGFAHGYDAHLADYREQPTSEQSSVWVGLSDDEVKDKALKMAIEALEEGEGVLECEGMIPDGYKEAIQACKEALGFGK